MDSHRTEGQDAGMDPHELPRPARPTATRRELLTAGAVTAAAAVTAPLIAIPAHAGDGPASGPGGPYRSQPPDHTLRSLLRQLDSRRVAATIHQLVAFGTRHTLSSQADPVRGIGAATDWVFQQMQSFAAGSGGRMTVEKQSFVQPVAGRIPTPTVITNCIATLRGDTAPDRIYVVTAHLDS